MPDGRKVSKVLFILYSPDDNPDGAQKFAVACNKDILKQKVSECNMDAQINSWDELDFDEIGGKLH